MMSMPAPTIQFDDVLGTPAVDKRLEVLRSMHHAGSISEAARANGVSYKAAWQALETLSNLAGVPLVDKAVGGSGGGGAKLTPAGLQVLEAADLLHSARQQALAQLGRSADGLGLNWRGIAGMGMRTSMRNQMPCTVQEIRQARGDVTVVLALPDGQPLSSRITLESLQLLGLAPGQKVLAMCKATAVTVAPTIVGLGGVNLLRGKVLRRGAGAAGVEVSLQLCPGLGLVGFADAQTPLKLRQAAMAAIEPHAVVIGLAA
jgi:molybdate transport system regulatory protein